MDTPGPLAVSVSRDIMVPVRDGVRLATDLYCPVAGARGGTGRGDPDRGQEGSGPWPTLLERTPYDKRALECEARFFASHGYAVAIQDVRGRFASEGEFEPFVREAEDGYDTMRWLLQQPWCSGRIGTIGTSYLACTQAALATLDPPGLAAQFISQGFSNYHTTRSRRGGAYEHHRTGWLFRMAADSREARADPSLAKVMADALATLPEWISVWPIRRGMTPLAALPAYEQSLFDFMTRADYDEWWKNPALSLEPHYDRYPDLPVHFLGSWYDPYSRAVTDNYLALAARKRGPIHLLMGPWVHGVSSLAETYSGDVEFGPEAALEYNRLRLSWFDHWLKTDGGTDLQLPRVRIFVMGGGTSRKTAEGRLDHGGRWRDEDEWPLARTRPTAYYLRAGGALDPAGPTGDPPGGAGAAGSCEKSTSYTFDPRDPQPSVPDPRDPAELFPRGGFDVRAHPAGPFCRDGLPLGNRHDVLVFATGPLPEPVEVTGPATVDLYAGSTGPDTDFTARLVDWYPPTRDYPEGYALELCQTILRARYRNSRERAELMIPGAVCRFRLILPPVSNLFGGGHRIRLDVSSSDYPRFDVNPNTGEPLGLNRRMQAVTNTVYHSAGRASRIVLPIIPSGG